LIPDFNAGGVLPPFLGAEPGGPAAFSSPYTCDPLELVNKLSTTPHRGRLLLGLFRFREALRAEGITSGLQWVDGSFTEDVEKKGREPGDIDVVTVFERPAAVAADPAWDAFVAARAGGIFNRAGNKATYKCDTLWIDLGVKPRVLVGRATYWYGLFSHQRLTFQWKGMLSLDLSLDDTPAIDELARRGVP
jgi:hypothetical protein